MNFTFRPEARYIPCNKSYTGELAYNMAHIPLSRKNELGLKILARSNEPSLRALHRGERINKALHLVRGAQTGIIDSTPELSRIVAEVNCE